MFQNVPPSRYNRRMDLVDQVRCVRRLPSPARARAIREEAGATQEQFAAELGVTRLSIWRWETGKCRPRGESAIRYARLLDALQDELAS